MSVYLTGFGHWRDQALTPDGAVAPLAADNFELLPEVRRADVQREPDKSFGRMDALCRLGLLCCSRALRDAGLYSLEGAPQRPLPRPCGMVAATGAGCLGTDAAYLETCREQGGCSPHLFAYTLPSILLGEAALRFDLRGPALAMQEEPGARLFSSLAPVRAALDFLLAGDALAMLAGCCEVDLPPVLADTLPLPARGGFFLVLEKSPPPAYARLKARLAPVAEDGPVNGLTLGGSIVFDLPGLLKRWRS